MLNVFRISIWPLECKEAVDQQHLVLEEWAHVRVSRAMFQTLDGSTQSRTSPMPILLVSTWT